MGFFKAPDEFYTLVSYELKQGYRDDGLYLKCFASKNGQDDKAMAAYIDARADALHAEHKANQRSIATARQTFKRASEAIRQEKAAEKAAPAIHYRTVEYLPTINLGKCSYLGGIQEEGPNQASLLHAGIGVAEEFGADLARLEVKYSLDAGSIVASDDARHAISVMFKEDADSVFEGFDAEMLAFENTGKIERVKTKNKGVVWVAVKHKSALIG